ncbi:MAG: type III secretion system cytoplasmic ring protein SctQ [Myxococcales bacterium]|nr:type III secretion system cytoplasmic ring protein SctQ [Myxococcales bacterium]
MMSTPTFRPAKKLPPPGGSAPPQPARPWRPFVFANLEKVSRNQMVVSQKLEWLLPGVAPTGQVTEGVRNRLKSLFEEEVRMFVDYVHVIPPRALRKYVGEPTFMAALAPQPHKTRGFMEVDLALAHAAIDMLLGGAGETVALRPLSDIEEGVMSYVILEMLKALSPDLDPGLPKLRLEGLVHGLEEVIQLVGGDEPLMAVVQLKAVLGAQTGYVRLFIPATVLGMVNPPSDSQVVRTRRAAAVAANSHRLAGVKTWLRAEIGTAEISSQDLLELRDRDVVLLEQLTARPDRGEGGSARLRVGAGRVGWADAEVVLEEGRYKAKLTAFHLGEGPRQDAEVAEPAAEAAPGGEGGASPGESTNPNLEVGRPKVDESTLKNEGGELLNDIPLQIAIELARVPVTAEGVVSLKVGQVLDLNRVPGEPVELSVNGKIVARGELVEVDGHLGVRILSLA